MDYERLYHILFNAMTDAIWSIDEEKSADCQRGGGVVSWNKHCDEGV